MLKFNKQKVFCAIGAEERVVLSAMQKYRNERLKIGGLIDAGGGNLGFYMHEPDLMLLKSTGMPYSKILDAVSKLTECGIITKVCQPEEFLYLWVVDQDKIRELEITKEIPDNISFKINPFESIDIVVLSTSSELIPMRIEEFLINRTLNLDYESKEIQSNLKLIGKKMNPFADGEISLPDLVCMASFILIEGVYEIMTLNTNAKIYKSEDVRMAKSQDLYIKLDTVIPNTERCYVDSSNCNSTPNIKSESILYFESNLDEEIDLLTIIDDVFAQWIRILLGYQEARVEYLLYSFPCNDM